MKKRRTTKRRRRRQAKDDLWWWAELQLGNEFDQEDINKTYRKLAKLHHPDNGGSHNAMQRLNLARDVALALLQ